ncbi:predicted protein [Nematostella vectensis]|uniref:G-protein coupled receptors family 1 profile domain-containing protein n=1 Tax=Nematostella vectensis TaxID=45351 RepID=A7SKC6_NEMVE|nr:predicted protein [Nematostella vectensis]|eukprot:XP_001627898.1 predicted protein [Nematostella vectensis]
MNNNKQQQQQQNLKSKIEFYMIVIVWIYFLGKSKRTTLNFPIIRGTLPKLIIHQQRFLNTSGDGRTYERDTSVEKNPEGAQPIKVNGTKKMYFQLQTNLTNQSESLSMNPTNQSELLSDMNNQSQSRYVWAPVPASFRWTAAAVMILVAVGSCFGNGMVLYLVKIQSTRSLRTLQRTLTRHFIRSLAWSSLLTSLVSIPLMVSSLLVDYLKTDWACRAQRYLESAFIFITINNLIVIGVERYLVIYKPSKVPTTETTKRLVKAAWVMGAILTIIIPGSTTKDCR